MAAKPPDPFWQTYEGLRAPNFTQMPNELFDQLLPRLSESQLKVVLVLARKTFGWHQPITAASLSELAAATGLGRRSIAYAVDELEAFGVILVHSERAGDHSHAINLYCLRMANADDTDIWQSMPRRDAPKHQLPLDV